MEESVATLRGTKGLVGMFNNTITLRSKSAISTCRPAIRRGDRLCIRRGEGVTRCTTKLVRSRSFVCLSTKAAANCVVSTLKRAGTIFIAGTISRTRELTTGKVGIFLVNKRLGDSARTIVNTRTVGGLRRCRFAGNFFKTGKVAGTRKFAAPSTGRTLIGRATVREYGGQCVLTSRSGFKYVDSIAFSTFIGTGVLASNYPTRCRRLSYIVKIRREGLVWLYFLTYLLIM